MKNYIYQNDLIGKKQLRQLLAWSFTNYNSMQACSLADELKFLGFQYASQAGISISIEDLKVPFVKNVMLEKANQEIITSEKIYLKGRITNVERFQKIIDTWSLTSESLKDQIVYYFKNYDPLNSVYIMAFSGARGNLSQVRQLVGMRGLMSDPSGEIMNLPIKKNFREGLTITDYLMSGYGARKGIVDTALKTANSGYLTRRLIDVSQDILVREKDCTTRHSIRVTLNPTDVLDNLRGRVLHKSLVDPQTGILFAKKGTQITTNLLETCKRKKTKTIYFRSPLTCSLYRSVCQNCYGWDLASEHIVDIGEAIGILAGQSIGEPGTQLTMRTFHTGGIFTSEARQQIISPIDGIVQFYKTLKTIVLRTNRGEEVLITKNAGSVVLVPRDKQLTLTQIEVAPNTILFPKNNQYILKDTVIGESLNLNRQVKSEIKPILSDTSGEIFIPVLKKKIDYINNNKLIWILSGQLYTGPNPSFLNYHSDYKMSDYSYIFRTKLNAHYSGNVEKLNFQKNLSQGGLQINNVIQPFLKTTLKKLQYPVNQCTHLLSLKNTKYLMRLHSSGLKNSIEMTKSEKIGQLVSNSFQTYTGGILYYDIRSSVTEGIINKVISYFEQLTRFLCDFSIINFRTICWLGEEFYDVNCDKNDIFVEQGDFVSANFKLVSNLFSKTSGRVVIKQRLGKVTTILIQSGLIYEGKRFKKIANKLYYPGESIWSGITFETVVFCEYILGKNREQLLVRPVKFYEFPHSSKNTVTNLLLKTISATGQYEVIKTYLHPSRQRIKSSKTVDLTLDSLILKNAQQQNKTKTLDLVTNNKKASVTLKVLEQLRFNDYVVPGLIDKNIQPCFLTQKQQFISKYTTILYLEAVTAQSLEVVKFKTQKHDSKNILLISNNDCFNISKKKIPTKTLDDFVVTNSNIMKMGKVIVDNGTIVTLQKGRPYFFPNCLPDDRKFKSELQYKFWPTNRSIYNQNKHKQIKLDYFDITKFVVKKQLVRSRDETVTKIRFNKLFLKSSGKLYNSLVPRFSKKFTINKQPQKKLVHNLFEPAKFSNSSQTRINRTVLLRRSEKKKNKDKIPQVPDYQLISLKFMEQPFSKSTKKIGLYSITKDYFEQDVNSVFCKNNEFISAGKTIGLLNLEKEITGDIVQGLPRIEEILEARKRNIILKKIPTSQKKGLLVQVNNLDPNFEFKKIGMPIAENDKTNPHKLLKVYFNYYGLKKTLICTLTKSIKRINLTNNYEGSYKSFKKVQLFILNSVQSVYKSQGVTINDKHLEVIIKQMTSKVVVTSEGNTPLLKREVVDLQHIKYIDEVIQTHSKQSAYYVPLLLGITKAALNNPSFISAASFQETTRVLTKAAIEGRIDWLRGLKENIIIGHLIPAGTGTQNYRNGFENKNKLLKNVNTEFLEQKSRQVF